jgi:predicted permease
MRERSIWRRYLRLLTNDPAAAVEDEVEFHLAMRVEDLQRRGLPESEARLRAEREFGDVDRIQGELVAIGRERARRRARAHVMESMVQDVRFALRTLRKRPGVPVVAVATLAVGIGVSVMIYDASRALATDAVPFPEADRLVTVDLRGERGVGINPSFEDFRIWASEVDGLLALGAYTTGNRFVGDGSRTFRVPGSSVTGGFFALLAIDPVLGRTFSSGDATPGDGLVTVISQRLWDGRFGTDPDIIGKPIRIDGRVHTIIGVVPAGLQFPAGTDLWTPLRPTGDDAASLRVSVIGRLKTRMRTEEARAALATIQVGLDRERPAEDRASRVAVVSLTGRPDGADRTALLLVQCAVVVLLLITLTNAAGLMLTRAIARRQEITVRTSLGASRGRIVRQFLVESALLAVVSGVLGLAVAHLAIGVLRNTLPATQTRYMLGWDRLGLDGHAVAFALALAALTGVVFGIVPALRAVRGDPAVQLRDGAPTAARGRREGRLLRLLLCGEVALALTLLLSGGLLTRSLLALLSSDPGFEADGVLTVEWALPPELYDGQNVIARFQDPLLKVIGGLPGVRSAGLVSNLPMSRTGWGKPYRVHGSDPDADAQSASWRPITPEYLRTLGVDLLRGRHMVRTDRVGAPRVAIVSEALAHRHWPDGANPLGRQLEVEGEAWTVVGVADDVHNFGAQRQAEPTIYVPQAQSPSETGFLAIRVAGDPAGLAPRLRQEIWSVDPDVAVGEIRTMPRMVQDFYAGARVMALLMALFASISLLITVVSLYTLVAHSVARRRREIGIRRALGAREHQVIIGAMSQGIVWVGAGIVIGLVLSTGAAQVLASILYGIRPLDPVVFILIPVGLLAVAFLASYLPASGAAAVDPIETLRGG